MYKFKNGNLLLVFRKKRYLLFMKKKDILLSPNSLGEYARDTGDDA